MADETMTDEQILEHVEHKSFRRHVRPHCRLAVRERCRRRGCRPRRRAGRLRQEAGEDVQVLDLTELSGRMRLLWACHRYQQPPVDSIVDEIEEKVAEACGEHPFSIEGREQKTWMLMDYGSVVVHVFTPKPATSTASRNSGETPPSSPLNLL